MKKPLAVIQELAYNSDNRSIVELARKSGVDLAAIVEYRLFLPNATSDFGQSKSTSSLSPAPTWGAIRDTVPPKRRGGCAH
jgi:hypothetical protein